MVPHRCPQDQLRNDNFLLCREIMIKAAAFCCRVRPSYGIRKIVLSIICGSSVIKPDFSEDFTAKSTAVTDPIAIQKRAVQQKSALSIFH